MYYYLTKAGKHEEPQQFAKGGGIDEKLFISRDHSGRGEKPVNLTQSHILKFWDLEEVDDNNEQPLGEWIEQCEVGHTWRRGTEELERLESKFAEGGKVGTYEYKTIDTRSREGIEEANRLQAEGWKVLSSELNSWLLESPKVITAGVAEDDDEEKFHEEVREWIIENAPEKYHNTSLNEIPFNEKGGKDFFNERQKAEYNDLMDRFDAGQFIKPIVGARIILKSPAHARGKDENDYRFVLKIASPPFKSLLQIERNFKKKGKWDMTGGGWYVGTLLNIKGYGGDSSGRKSDNVIMIDGGQDWGVTGLIDALKEVRLIIKADEIEYQELYFEIMNAKATWDDLEGNKDFSSMQSEFEKLHKKIYGDAPYPTYAKGGGVTFVSEDDKHKYDWAGKGTKEDSKAVGSFSILSEKNSLHPHGKLWEGYLYELNDFDNDYYKYLPLKEGEKLYRYTSETSDIGGYFPVIKVNLEKGLIYFLENMYSDDDKNLVFQSRGIKPNYISISESEKIYKVDELGNQQAQEKYEKIYFELMNHGDEWSAQDQKRFIRMQNEFKELHKRLHGDAPYPTYAKGGGVDNVSTKTKTILGVTHNIMREPVDYIEMKQIEFVHPLGTVYSDGTYGYVASGYDWLRFDINELAEIKVNMNKFSKEDGGGVDDVSENEMRETYVKAFGKEFDSEDRKQAPLPLNIAYQVALEKIKREGEFTN